MGRGPDFSPALPKLLAMTAEPPPPELPPGTVLLRSPVDSAVAAAGAIGAIAPGTDRESEAITALARLLGSDVPGRPGAAGAALAQFPGLDAEKRAAVFEALRRASKGPGHGSDWLRLSAAVEKMADASGRREEAIALFIEATGAEEPALRSTAAAVLGRFAPEDARALERLRLLADRDPESVVRNSARSMLDQIQAGSAARGRSRGGPASTIAPTVP